MFLQLKSWFPKRGAAVILSAALLSFGFGFRSQYVMPKVLIFGLGLLWIGYEIIRGAKINMGDRIAKLGALFFVVMIGSSLFAIDKWLALCGRNSSYTMGLLGTSLALLYYFVSEKDENVKYWISTTGCIVGLFAFAQYFGIANPYYYRIAGHRAVSTIGSPVDLGVILAMILPISLCVSPIHALAIGLGLLASGSKGAWLAAVVVTMLYAKKLRSAAVLMLFLVGGVMFYSRPILLSERFEIYKISWKIIKDNPIIGVGPDGFENAFRKHRTAGYIKAANSDYLVQADAHNDVLQVLATMGIVGLAAYCILLYGIFSSIQGVALLSLLALFINAKFNPVPLESLILAGVICGSF